MKKKKKDPYEDYEEQDKEYQEDLALLAEADAALAEARAERWKLDSSPLNPKSHLRSSNGKDWTKCPVPLWKREKI